MTSTPMRTDDHETLSALFDGELPGDARLFALRRLGHDAAWQAHCGRWQLIGDALRRQAPIAAPGDFAARVSAAVAASAVTVAAEPARGRRMRWIGGGALAASVALAVAVSTLPLGRGPETAAPVLASSPSATPASPRVVVASEPARTEPARAEREPVAAPAPREVAVVPTVEPRSATMRRTFQSAPRGSAPRAVAAANTPAVAEATRRMGESGNPFNLASNETLTARPWPRATLHSSGSAFTARYGEAGESADERPSFYPFEPRLQAEPSPAP